MLHSLIRRGTPLLVGLLCASAVSAQSGILAGKVTARDGGRGLDAARVAVTDGARTVAVGTTRDDGTYSIGNVAAGTYTVITSRIGFQLVRTPGIVVRAGATTTVNPVMDEIPTQLNVVVTTASRRPEKALDAPAQMTVLPADRIAEKPANTVADIVRGAPGIDVSQGGIAQSNIVARGFNNAFSGSLLMLQDYRFAGVPSLRVNVPYFSLGQPEDMERIELLLGPASALYGPNSGAGVLHVITKSPFNSQGTTLTVDGGTRDIFRGAIRHAGTVGSKFGYKFTGEYFTGNDFEYRDPGEPDSVRRRLTDGSARVLTRNQRDFGFERYNGEARIDIRPREGVELISTASYSNVLNAIELTGANGASQIRGWTYTNLQQRVRWGRFFAQAFANISNSGNSDSTGAGTFLLRSGTPIVDQSRVYTGQVQHGFGLKGGDVDFVYGADYIRTNPRTGGTINGRNEAVDNVTEYGAYVQGKAKLATRWDFLAALRVDRSSVIDGSFISPRAALTWKPVENQSMRFVFNRSFNTPANFSFFLDLPSTLDAAGFRRNAQLNAAGFTLTPYDVIATGNRPKVGMNFARGGACAATSGFDNFCMRSPFIGAGATSVGASAATALPAFVTQQRTGFINALTAGYAPALGGNLALANQLATLVVNRLAAAAPTNDQIGTVGRLGATTITPAAVQDFAPLQASFNNTYEVGYKGLSKNGRLSFDVSAWAQQRGDVAVTAALSTPWIFANPTQTGQFVGAQAQAALTPLVLAGQLTTAQLAALAQGAATGLTPVLAGIPLGTITFDDPTVTNANLRATYSRLAKEVRVWGADVGLSYQFNEKWSGDWSGSVVNQVVWDDVRVGTSPFSLNAPGAKSTLTARFNDPETNWGFEARHRYTGGFPVNSGVFESFVFNPSGAGSGVQYPGVPTANLFDVMLTRRFPSLGKGVLWSLSASNVFDRQVATFVGTPNIGRLVMTRLSWTF